MSKRARHAAKRERMKNHQRPGPDPRPGPGRANGRGKVRRKFEQPVLLNRTNRETRLPEQREDKVEWKATQSHPLVRRARNRARNKMRRVTRQAAFRTGRT